MEKRVRFLKCTINQTDLPLLIGSLLLAVLILNLLKPTGYMMHQPFQHSTTVRSARTVFMCFVFI